MVYKIKKSIPQYTLVDLLEILQYPKHPEYHLVKKEYAKRNPSNKELLIARRGLVYRNKTRHKPLSFVDILYCLLTPFIAPKNKFTIEKDIDKSYEDQLDEFIYYNESRKAKQLMICKKFVLIFIGFIVLAIFVFLLYQAISA